MCELLGISFNEPVDIDFTFRGFRYRGERNPHGWGLAYYPDEAAQILKEPLRANKSALANLFSKLSIYSKIFISHVRYSSRGSVSYKNTHPFHRELNGKEYVFAHNGTLNIPVFDIKKYKPIGETDSEYAFCYLLQCIDERNFKQWTSEYFYWLHDVLIEINSWGSINCIFSDGAHLFCYADMNGYNNLSFVRRIAPFGHVQLTDEDYEIDLSTIKNPSQKGFIIATHNLTNEIWEKFSAGELCVFKNGEFIFSSNNQRSETYAHLKQEEIKILTILRESPHRLSLKSIHDISKIAYNELISLIVELVKKGYIKQDSRDSVSWSNENATYYTIEEKRSEIDRFIHNRKTNTQ